MLAFQVPGCNAARGCRAGAALRAAAGAARVRLRGCLRGLRGEAVPRGCGCWRPTATRAAWSQACPHHEMHEKKAAKPKPLCFARPGAIARKI